MRNMRYATLGSISTATLRPGDLLDAFACELEYQVQRNAAAWCSDEGRRERDYLMSLVGQARELLAIDTDNESLIESTLECASELLCELSDALNQFAPADAYFGAHEGDGADYGFWPIAD